MRRITLSADRDTLDDLFASLRSQFERGETPSFIIDSNPDPPVLIEFLEVNKKESSNS